jgi:hypothetical protein
MRCSSCSTGSGWRSSSPASAITYYLLSLTDKLSYNIALVIGIALGTLFRFWSYRRWVWVAPSSARRRRAPTGAGRCQAGPAMAGHPAGQAGQAGQHVPSRNGAGHAPGLLHANGHGDGDQTAHTGPSPQSGWDR